MASHKTPYTISVSQHSDQPGLLTVVVSSDHTNFQSFQDFYRGLSHEFTYADLADFCEVTDSEVCVRFVQFNQHGVVISGGYRRISISFRPEVRELVLAVLARLAYIHFEQNPVSIDCQNAEQLDDMVTFSNFAMLLLQNKMKVAPKSQQQQSILAKLMTQLQEFERQSGLAFGAFNAANNSATNALSKSLPTGTQPFNTATNNATINNTPNSTSPLLTR